MPLRERERTVRYSGRQPVVARDPAHLFDDVFGDRDVGPYCRRCRDEGVAVRARRELQSPKDVECLRRIDVDAHHSRDIGETHPHVHSRAGVRVAIDDALDLCSGMLAEQPASPRERDRDQVR